VRVNCNLKVMNNKGEVVDVKQVDDAAFYQDFFSKVDKGIFMGRRNYRTGRFARRQRISMACAIGTLRCGFFCATTNTHRAYK
jgi:hypothetical protein